MPWKQDYTISDEIGIADRDVIWPDGFSCCVKIIVDLNPASDPRGISKADFESQGFYYGMEEGLSQILSLFDQLGIKATFAVPALVAELFPDRIAKIAGSGHEIAPNGRFGEDVRLLSRGLEDDRIGQATETIEWICGNRPTGWYGLPRACDPFATGSVSANTISLLIQHRFEYFGNGNADDVPHYWVADFQSKTTLLALPYNYNFDDRFFLMFPQTGTGLERPDALLCNWREQFAAQYARGRCFTMTISPIRSGWGHRLLNLASFLREVREHPGIWTATAKEVARHWTGQYPAESHLRLSPSIWQDHAGSLS